MTHKPEDGLLEEIILPENLLPLGSVLGEGVTPLDVSMVLAQVFNVQHAEVALLRLEGGLLKFIFPNICAHRSDSNLQQSRGGAHRSQQESRNL